MVDIDFIKWMCDKAEGFEFNEGDFVDDNYVTTPTELDIDMLHDISSDLWIKGLYPLLIQRAFRFCIVNELSYMSYDDLVRILGSDEEIEKYLRYIYEQETK